MQNFDGLQMTNAERGTIYNTSKPAGFRWRLLNKATHFFLSAPHLNFHRSYFIRIIFQLLGRLRPCTMAVCPHGPKWVFFAISSSRKFSACFAVPGNWAGHQIINNSKPSSPKVIFLSQDVSFSQRTVWQGRPCASLIDIIVYRAAAWFRKSTDWSGLPLTNNTYNTSNPFIHPDNLHSTFSK